MAGTIITVFLLTIAVFAGGYFVGSRSTMSSIIGSSASGPRDVDLAPLWLAWDEINSKFVPAAVATSSPIATSTALKNERKVYGMIEGLAASLNDPYTFFLPPTENTQFTADMKGSFEGVGMEIEVKDQILTVVSPLKGTPASNAGIKSEVEQPLLEVTVKLTS